MDSYLTAKAAITTIDHLFFSLFLFHEFINSFRAKLPMPTISINLYKLYRHKT